MDIPLICYRISGWLITVTEIALAIFALKTKRMWQGKYLFLGILFCFNAISSISSMVTALLLTNNLFLDYLVAPANFTFKALYLRDFRRQKAIRWGVIILIIVYVGLNIFTAFYKDGYKSVNTFAILINRAFFMLFTLWNLTLMFKNKTNGGKLRQNPDFWFTATMLCFAFKGLMFTIVTDISYSASSDLVLYVIFISENLINALLLYGYFKGVKLLR